MEYVRTRIETASVVIAELSDANPNVYLEVGYAWGKGRPTILLVKDEKALQFDVRGQRCLVYERIKDLEDMLAQELKGMIAKGSIQVNHAR
jgi:nucleoside 2-deoxyribosyltransferase